MSADANDDVPAGPARLAESLQEATVESLVYVDGRGQVRSLDRYRKASAIYHGSLAALLGVLNATLWLGFGPVGLGLAGAVTALVGRQIVAMRRLRRATELVVGSRLDEAEALLSRIRRGFLLPPHLKGRAEHVLARVATLRGRYEDALAHLESALGLIETSRSLRGTRRAIEYGRMVTLVNLDRADEARRRLAALPRAMEGDYLRFVRATTELYIALGEGRHDLDAAYLREQAEIALGIPTGHALLALVAWAQHSAGDRAAAARLLAAARERDGAALARAMYPRLVAWMDTQPRAPGPDDT